jgi:hypothetical protein
MLCATRVWFWSTAALLTALSSCECDPEVVRLPGAIEGQACGEVSRVGIPNISVEVRGPVTKTVPTDGAGRFFAGALPEGSYTVVALLQDGSEQEVTLPNTPVDVGPDEVIPVIDTRCDGPPDVPDTGTIDGQICNRHTGELVSEATVLVIGANNDIIASGTTDTLGNFVLGDVPEGEHVVSIRAPNFSRSFPVTVVVGETTTLDLSAGGCAIPTTIGGAIVGSLCDPRGADGAKLAGATVRVHLIGSDAADDVLDVSDTAGEFYVGALLPGRYDVTVTSIAAGVNEVFADIEVVAGEEATIVGPDACADRTPVGRVQGQLCDLVNLGGLFTGTVTLHQGGTEKARTTTDAAGRFRFDIVATGTYELHLGEPAARIVSPVIVNAFQTTFIEEDTCPQPADICENFPHQPDVLSDGRILLVVDRSGSMNFTFGGQTSAQTKWEALKGVLSGVMSTLSTTVQYGLFVYPNPQSDGAAANCSAGVQRQAMGSTSSQINNALGEVNPAGGTPTATTMAEARAIVAGLAADDRPLAVVLATDGAPNCNLNETRPGVSSCSTDNGTRVCQCTCTSNAVGQSDANCAIFNCLDDSNTSAAIADIAALGVQTHVIGIPDTGLPAGLQAIFQGSLNTMAVAGGAPLAGAIRYHNADNVTALQASLEAVTRRILACQITVPTSLDGATSVEVRLGDQPIPQDPSHRNGWDQTGPAGVQLFGNACDAATASLSTVTVRRCARP